VIYEEAETWLIDRAWLAWQLKKLPSEIDAAPWVDLVDLAGIIANEEAEKLEAVKKWRHR
jgi:hypothetical protein